MKLEPANYLLYQWRYILGYGALVVVFIAAITLAALYSPGGLSQFEVDNLANTLLLSEKNFAITNLPYHALQLLSIKLFGISTLSIKLPSLLLSILAVVAVFFLLRRWFKSNIAVLSMLIMLATGQLIFIAQSATPQILYVTYSALILLFSSLILQDAKGGNIWRIALAVTASLSLYTPYFLYINLAIIITALVHPSTRYHLIRKSKRHSWILAVLLFTAITVPLILLLVNSQETRISMIGLSGVSGVDLIANLKMIAKSYFWVAPIVQNSQITPIFDFSSVALIVLGFIVLFRHSYAARSYLILTWLIMTLPVIIVRPYLIATVLVPLFILLALGVETLLSEWYKLFPKNPYARTFGLVLTIGLVGIMVFSGIDRFTNGYRHMPEAVNGFSNDLTTLKRHLASMPAKTQLYVGEQEFPLYLVFEKYSHRNIVVSLPGEKAQSTNVLVSHEAKPEMNLKDAKLTHILTNGRLENADRFYLYKVN